MQVIEAGQGGLLKMWTGGMSVEDSAMQQLLRVARLPFVKPWVAVMPDVHTGIGATIGSVVPMTDAISPSIIGVDLGCGMIAIQTNLIKDRIKPHLKKIRKIIEAAVPTGNGPGGKWKNNSIPKWISGEFRKIRTEAEAKNIFQAIDQNVGIETARLQLGTLGGGNHFIEVQYDENDCVWLMLHSGSRKIGNDIGRFFIDKAKQHMKNWHIKLEDINLAYLPKSHEDFHNYLLAANFAQEYAELNRDMMLLSIVTAWNESGIDIIEFVDNPIKCHHNFVRLENHGGKNYYVARKGATSARKDELAIIPGSMGSQSFIVRGLGNPDSFNSCSHGAGRLMSRSAAKQLITMDDHLKATAGVECRTDNSILDESPAAYKNINQVIAAQSDLVEVVHTLKQLVCVKG